MEMQDSAINKTPTDEDKPSHLRQEAAQEAARQEAARQEAARQEAARQEAARQEAARQEAARQEAARQEAARQEAARQEAARQEAARQEAARQEAARQEAARQEAARQEAASTGIPPVPVGQTFADFMYAVVVGVAFSDIKLSDPWYVLFATIILLLMVLEDFYMYQTQVKLLSDVFKFWTLSSLFFEVGLLLAWFLAFLSRRESLSKTLVLIAIFYFLKWFASAKHIPFTPKPRSWVLHRDHLFWITILCSIALIFLYPNFGGSFIVLSIAWGVQTVIWWMVVGRYQKNSE